MNGAPAALQSRDPACAAAQVKSRRIVEAEYHLQRLFYRARKQCGCLCQVVLFLGFRDRKLEGIDISRLGIYNMIYKLSKNGCGSEVSEATRQ